MSLQYELSSPLDACKERSLIAPLEDNFSSVNITMLREWILAVRYQTCGSAESGLRTVAFRRVQCRALIKNSIPGPLR